MTNERIVPSAFDTRPGLLNRELRDMRLRIEALERAIRDADEAVRAQEGVSLAYYMEDDAESRALISEVMYEDG